MSSYKELMDRARGNLEGGDLVEWEEGKEVVGELLTMRWNKSQFNPDEKYLTLTVKQENEELVRIPCGAVLQRECEDQKILEGMIIGITCGGKGRSKNGKEFWKFGVSAQWENGSPQAESHALTQELDNG